MKPEAPPRLSTWLLSRCLPPRAREAVLGDLAEEWRAEPKRGLAARAWYWREAAALAIGYGSRRLAISRRLAAALRGLWAESANALRHLVRAPRYSIVALLLLGGGLAVATTLSSVIHATFLAPLPYPAPDRLVRLHETHLESGVVAGPVAPANFLDFMERTAGLRSLATAYATEAALTGRQPVESIRVGVVAGDLFGTLGVEPLLGRTFLPEDVEGAHLDNAGRFRGPARVIVDERLWRSRFEANSTIVGEAIAINGQEATIVGVVPTRVPFPEPEVRAWVAWDLTAAAQHPGGLSRNARFTTTIARLADRVALADATAEIANVAQTLALAHPETNEGWSATLRPLSATLTEGARRPLTLLGVAITLLLLGVCINLAGMQLARDAARTSEIAIRSALGASRVRIVSRLLLENLLLALAAAILGLVGARTLLAVLLPSLPELPRPIEPGLAPAVVTGTALMALVAGLLTGGLTAARISRVEPARGLRGHSGRTAASSRSGRGLVIAQIALAVTLVAVSGLLARSFAHLLTEDPGFEPAGVLTARLNLEAGVSADASERVAFFDRLLAELRSEPGVIHAAGATFLPMSGIGPDFDRPYWRPDEPRPGGSAPRAWIRIVTPDLFRTLGVRLRSGRAFGPADRFDFTTGASSQTSPRVAIVNRTLARRSWPEGAVGETLIMDYPGSVHDYRIVGVVEDVRPRGLGERAEPEIYLPYGQIPYPGLTVAVRTRGAPLALAPRLRQLVGELNPLQPVDRVTPLARLVASSLDRERIVLATVGLFGLSAALLAALGVFGLVDLRVQERGRELGIRLALGARPEELRRHVLWTAGALTAAGVGVGLGITLAAARWLAGSLYRTSPLDPLALGGTVVIVSAAALVAAWRPARRATRVDPVESLRSG